MAADLEKWFDLMLHQVSNTENIEVVSYARRCEDIFSLAMHELIRQISEDCVERGRLAAKIWVRMVEMFRLMSVFAMDSKMYLGARLVVAEAEVHRLSTAYERDVYGLQDILARFEGEVLAARRALHSKDDEIQELQKQISALKDTMSVLTTASSTPFDSRTSR